MDELTGTQPGNNRRGLCFRLRLLGHVRGFRREFCVLCTPSRSVCPPGSGERCACRKVPVVSGASARSAESSEEQHAMGWRYSLGHHKTLLRLETAYRARCTEIGAGSGWKMKGRY